MTDDAIQHFVLTRFNIATPGRESEIRNRPGWLTRRFELFERYCLPSLAAQSERRFEWLIYFDAQTPDEFRDRIAKAQKVASFEARFVGITRMSDVAQDVVERTHPQTKRVLTTRLDNDDAVASSFLATVRARALASPDGTVLNFPQGLALNKGRLFTAYDASNPFTSLIEDSGNIQTIWSAQHRSLGSKWKLEQFGSEPLWLQIVHGENVANRIKGRRMPIDQAARDFVALQDVALKPVSRMALAIDNLGLYPWRLIREMGVDLSRPLRQKIRSLSAG